MGKPTLKKQLGSGSKSFQQNLLNIPVGHEETFLQTYLVDHVKQHFSVPTFFVAVSGKIGGKVPIVDDVPSSHEQEIYPTNSLDENCIEFAFQADSNYYVDLRQSLSALKLKFVKRLGYHTYERRGKNEHKEEFVVFIETGTDDEEEEVARVTYVNKILHSLFSNVEVYINNQRIYNSNGLYAHMSYISNNFR